MFKSRQAGQTRRWALALMAVGAAAVLAGCGGGGNGLGSSLGSSLGNNSSNPFKGNYTGAFSGVAADGTPVSGRFVGSVDRDGKTTGTVIQDNVGSFPATGTINQDGAVNLTARGGSGASSFVSTITGTATRTNGESVVQGTLATVAGGNTVVNGRFTAIRAGSSANPFAGNYTGSFVGQGASGSPIGGTFTATVDSNGTARGTVHQGGAAYPAIGTLERSGRLIVTSLFTLSNPQPIFTTELSGTVSTTNGVTTGSGTFTTQAGGQTNATGTFQLARTGTD